MEMLQARKERVERRAERRKMVFLLLLLEF